MLFADMQNVHYACFILFVGKKLYNNCGLFVIVVSRIILV